MKNILNFNLFTESTQPSEIKDYLTKTTFDKLPLNYKKGLLPWMYEGDKAEWSINKPITDWVNDKNVEILIDDYSKEFGNEMWYYGMVPTDLIIKKISNWIDEEGDYNSFNEYHKIYQSTNYANHGTSLFPIIVSDEDAEYILDGWHRFHYYISKGYKEIPVIEYIG